MTYDETGEGGHRARTGRRLATAGAAAAVAALVVAMAALAAPSTRKHAEPANEPVNQPATPKALASVALDHVDGTPASVTRTHPETFRLPGAVAVDIRFRAGEGEDGDLLRVAAVPGTNQVLEHCGDFYEFDTWQADGGEVILAWQLEAPEEDPGILLVVQQRADEYTLAYQSGDPITADPRTLDLDTSVHEMVAVVTDPRLGLRTTESVLREAGELPAQVPGEDESGAEANSQQITPRAIAGVVESATVGEVASREAEGHSGYGERVIGAQTELETGTAVTLLVVEQPDPLTLDCPERMTCVILEPDDGGVLTLGWNRTGDWTLVHVTDVATRVLQVLGDSRTGDPRTSPGDVRFDAMRNLVQDPVLAPITPNRVLIEGDRVDDWEG
ncbi:hypothetical protein EKO23_00480 [Nocardioides guangzhouensis]|uniref:Uncharacterized protein n=1 Tax=Nocardioides guangzhouensis TaxID=2497878 RepID=A0A4Q4ZKR6_9ACTN|nr:hypothetical protein [Nocardioides guangzhouensis]RYP88950.1 hypothetical protein EKO23_00480 [Nocardioides guangzhouensis]